MTGQRPRPGSCKLGWGGSTCTRSYLLLLGCGGTRTPPRLGEGLHPTSLPVVCAARAGRTCCNPIISLTEGFVVFKREQEVSTILPLSLLTCVKEDMDTTADV